MEKNIYSQLASIPRELADKITNAKTGGGRSLNAIHKSKNLNSSEKHLLLILANEMDFRESFEYQYRFISLASIAETMSVNKSTVIRIINGYRTKQKKVSGLIEKGYLFKQEATVIQQQNGMSNNYCLTSKIFDEYMFSLISQKLDKEKPVEGSRTMQQGVVAQCNRGSRTVQHNIPNTPKLSSNAAAQKPAAVKKCRPSRKMKIWDHKSFDEKMDAVLNKAVDAHVISVKQRKAKPYPFNDFPDVLRPVIQEFGVEKVRDFFDSLKNSGCDVRKLTSALTEFVCPAIVPESEPILIETEQNFSEEIIKQVETNKMYIPVNPIKFDEVKIETFPIRLKKFYDSLKSKRQKLSLKKEVSILGIENFLKMRATMILRCTYDELFTESVCKQTFF